MSSTRSIRWPILALLAAMLVLLPAICRSRLKPWREDQAGESELTMFERTVKMNDNRQTSEGCANRFGMPFWNAVKASKRSICDKVHSWDHDEFGMIMLENVSIASDTVNIDDPDTPYLDSQMDVFLLCSDPSQSNAAVDTVRRYAHSATALQTQQQMDSACSDWIDDPVLVLPWFDTANWWHFVEQGLFPAFLYGGIAQRELLETGRKLYTMTLQWPANRQHNVRAAGVYPTWVALPEVLERLIGPLWIAPLEPISNVCFRKMIWIKQRPTHLAIGNLLRKATTDCYSPILRAMADHVRVSMGVIPIPNPKSRIKVVYMSRDNSNVWTTHQRARSVNHRDISTHLAREIQAYGCEFEELRFYYTNMTNAREQILAIANAHIMVGVHGAGLAAMIALPPGSAVVELRGYDTNKHFHYLASLLGHSYYRSGYSLAPDAPDSVWSRVQAAIDETQIRHPKLRIVREDRPYDQ